MKISQLLLIVLSLNISQAQTITGNVLDAKSEHPLVYANVFLNNDSKGVFTNDKGYFNLELPKRFTSDSLIVSFIGYHKQRFLIKDVLESEILNVSLQEDEAALSEVILDVKKARYTAISKLKIKRKGTISSSVPFGHEEVSFIENEKFKEGKLTEVLLFFKESKKRNYKVYESYFRVRFYAVKNGDSSPGKLLSTENIIVKPENKTHQLKINVSDYHILFPKEGIFIGLEAINPKLEKPKKSLYSIKPRLINTHSKKPLSFSRISEGKWHKDIRKSFLNKKYYTSLLIGLKVRYRKDF